MGEKTDSNNKILNTDRANTVLTGDNFGQADGRSIDDVTCTGQESTLSECKRGFFAERQKTSGFTVIISTSPAITSITCANVAVRCGEFV